MMEEQPCDKEENNMAMREILKRYGFEAVQAPYYLKRTEKPEGYSILLEVKAEELCFRVPCASATVDHEAELEQFLQKRRGSECTKAAFCHRLMELNFACQNEEKADGCLREALELVEAVDREFDLLPVCTLCGRIGKAEPVFLEGTLQTMCGVCGDSLSLHISHEKLNERNFEKAKADSKKRPTLKFLLAGLTAGLWACLMGLLATIVYLALPLILFGSALAGATAGYLTIRYLRRINPKVTVHGVILGSFTALLTIVIVSPITTNLICKIFELLMFNTASVYNPLTTIAAANPLPYIILGLIVMLLTEVVSIFWITEDVVDI